MEKKDGEIIEEPEALDLILEYLIKNEGDYKSYREIHKDLFPEVDTHVFTSLANLLINRGDIVDGSIEESVSDEWPNDGEMKATGITKQFLHTKGGFIKYYKELDLKNELTIESESLSRQALRDQIKTNRVTRCISIISIVISILAFAISITIFTNNFIKIF